MANRGSKWMHLTGASNGVLCIPGDGIGSRLNLVVARATPGAFTVAFDAKNQVELDAKTSVVVGQLAITTDGFWGTITAISATNNVITVDRWKSVRADPANKAPGVGVTVNCFPAGSCIARADSVRLCRLVPTKSITGVSATGLLDYRMAIATPVLAYNSVVGVLNPIELETRLSGPFGLITNAIANFDCTVFFEIDG